MPPGRPSIYHPDSGSCSFQTNQFPLVSLMLIHEAGWTDRPPHTSYQCLSSSRNPNGLSQSCLPGNAPSRVMGQATPSRNPPEAHLYPSCRSKQPPNAPSNACFGFSHLQPAQLSTCSAQGFPEAALDPELVWHHHPHLHEEFRNADFLAPTSYEVELGNHSFWKHPADSDLEWNL